MDKRGARVREYKNTKKKERILFDKALKEGTVKNNESILEFLIFKYSEVPQEVAGLVLFDVQGVLIDITEVGIGDNKEIGKVYHESVWYRILSSGAEYVLFFHCHTDGTVEPSDADLDMVLKHMFLMYIFSKQNLGHLIISSSDFQLIEHDKQIKRTLDNAFQKQVEAFNSFLISPTKKSN